MKTVSVQSIKTTLMFYRLFFLLFFTATNIFWSTRAKPVLIIFDTDIAEDYDDVGALTILHVLAAKGEAKLLATISCNSFETTVPTISVLNDYFGRPDIPIGITKRKEPNRPCPQGWAQAIIKNYPHHLSSNSEAREAVALYREILSGQPDHSVTIVTVGFFTNIADLLSSPPDQYSPLNGQELVSKKIKQLVSMAARLDEEKNSGMEYNVCTDVKASQKVFAEWSRPFIISPFELGVKILTGIPLVKDSTIQNSPVKDAFTIALQKDKNETGRMSWDETAVLAAVRGANPYFSVRKINLQIRNDCSDTLITGDRISYLGFKMKPEQVRSVIEELMHQAPGKQR